MVGIGGMSEYNVGWIAFFIEMKAHVGCLKIDGTVFESFGAQLFCQTVEGLQCFGQLPVFRLL